MKKYIAIIKNVEKQKFKVLLNYLQNEKHSNHKTKTKILNIENMQNEDFESVNEFKILKNKKNKTYLDEDGKLVTKRGKDLKNSNKSLTFNIPKKYEVSEEQAQKIAIELNAAVKKEYKKNNYEIEQSEIFGNIHYQDNVHFNFIIPVLDLRGKTLLNEKTRFVNQKSFLNNLQKAFTRIVDIELKTNINDYKTQIEEIEEVEKVAKIEKFLTLEDIKREKEKHKNNKLLKRYYDYLYRLKNKEQEAKKLEEDNKDLKRVIDTYNKITTKNAATEEEIETMLRVFENLGFDRKHLSQDLKKDIRENRSNKFR